jgi:transposase
MLEATTEFVNKILSIGGFKRKEISNRAYKELLTKIEQCSEQDVVMISSIINRFRHEKGCLLLDATDNPKYGLQNIALKMKNLSNGGYSKGFKILLFVYRMKEKTVPVAFALIHKESGKQEELVLKILSKLRNSYNFKPQMVIADAAFSTQEIMKRLNNYGWAFVMKGRKNYSLDKKQVKKQVPRGFGSKTGRMNNGVKTKIVRRPRRVFVTNRVSLSDEEILFAYNLRWRIEEVFRAIKSCIGLNRCQQHSVRAQEVYVFGCMVSYSIIELIRTGSIYKAFENVFSGDLVVDEQIVEQVLLC